VDALSRRHTDLLAPLRQRCVAGDMAESAFSLFPRSICLILFDDDRAAENSKQFLAPFHAHGCGIPGLRFSPIRPDTGGVRGFTNAMWIERQSARRSILTGDEGIYAALPPALPDSSYSNRQASSEALLC